MTSHRIALAVLVGGALACLFVLFGMKKARAHDGYEPECCNERHCRPIAPAARQGAYWVLPDGRRFLAGTTRPSARIGKQGFHLCEWLDGESPPSSYESTRIVQPKGKDVCLYVPDAEH